MKGDRVEILVDVGDGVRAFDVRATKDGRRVEVSSSRGHVDVTEVTRSGRAVRTAQFMAARVVAIVEHPAAEDPDRVPQPRRRPPREQDSLGI
jgi:hypothetical protein